jgi:beta-glucuronidase
MSDDRVTVVTGFRTIEITDTALLINNDETMLLGISKHEDDPYLGATQDEALIAKDLGLIQEMGANYIRMSHYPHDIREIRACRDRGIMVSEEIPHYQVGLGWTTWFETEFKTENNLFHFPASTFGMKQVQFEPLLLSTRRQLIEMVERDINNPAVILWCVSNESYTLYTGAGRFYGHLRDVIRAFDDTRPVTKAEVTYDIPFFDNERMSADFLDIASVNSYYGWYYGTAEDAGPKLDIYHSQHPDRLVILTEFGASAAPGRTDTDGMHTADRVRPERTYSEEYQEYVIRTYLNAAREREYIVGVSPWIYADFYCPWFPGNVVPYYNMKGVVSRDRVPKRSYEAMMEIYTDIAENGR